MYNENKEEGKDLWARSGRVTGHPEQKKKVAYMRQIKSRARFKSGFRAGNGV